MEKNLKLSRIHREIYFHVKKKALSYEEHSQSAHFKKYKQDFIRFSKRDLYQSTLNKLINSTLNSNIVYWGDFHAFEQSTKNIQRILSSILEKQSNIAFALECLNKEKIKYVNQYLSNTISEEIFLKKIDFHKTWRFPWAYYKFFFDFARNYKLQIIPLNSKGTLPQRDNEAGKLIASFFKKNPETILFVVFGEYHVVVDKLPLQVKIRLGSKIKHTIIHQNLDQVYWRFQNTAQKPQIFQFNDFEYTLQSSPPWIKYDSACRWYEGVLDDPDLGLHENDEKLHASDSLENKYETFLNFAGKISMALSLDLSTEDLQDFNLYDNSNLKTVIGKIKKIKNYPLRNFYLKLVTRSKTFKLPMRNDYYCPSYAINRMAYLAGIHVLHKYLYNINPKYEYAQMSKSQENKFIFFLYRHMIAFFSSKIINPYRKCDYYLDIKAKLDSKETPERKKTYLRLAISILNDWNNTKELISKRSLKVLSSSAKLVGYILGEYLFEELLPKRKDSFNKIKQIILTNKNDHKNFSYLVSSILDGTDYKKQRKRFF